MQSVLNEKTAFSDIVDAIVTGAKKERQNNTKQYLNGSISRYTKNLIMSFPILCDDTLSIETAQMISKANERNMVTMVQLLFSSLSVKGSSGADILSQFHKNIDNTAMDDIIDTLDQIADYKESAIDLSKQRQILQEMVKDLKDPKFSKRFDESFSEKSINDYLVRETDYRTMVYEAPSPYSYGPDPEDPYAKTKYDSYNRQIDMDTSNDTLNQQRGEEEFRYRISKDQEDAERKEREMKMKQDQEDYRRKRDQQSDYNSLAQSQILPGDVKKSNELQPTLVVVNMNDVDDSGSVVNRISFLAGVKSRLIAIEAMDIVERIVAKNKTAINFKNFIKALTGEISFTKDFILCTKQAKINAKNAVKKGEAAKIWNILEKRANKNNTNKFIKSNDASAITTLVINQETVNYLKNAFKIDLSKPKDAMTIMNDYNFLGIVIADEANEVAKFLYDGNSNYEMVAYSSLSREASDKSYKKVINLINQAGR